MSLSTERGLNGSGLTNTYTYDGQRGPLSRTTLDAMKGWVDTSIGHGIWLVLVFHGIEGIGWEALTTDKMRACLDYIKVHQRQLWIATFQDDANYARERLNSTVPPT
jgi:hypothetical protein